MKRLTALICLLFLLCLTLPAGASLLDAAWVRNPDPADRLNLRAKPSTDAVSLGKFYSGTQVIVHSIDGDWANVTIGDHFTGYMHMDFLAFEPVPSAMPFVTVTTPAGKEILSDLNYGAQTLAKLYIGSQMEVMGVMEDWLYVRAGESIVGFTENHGTSPRIYFSLPEETPRMNISLLPTPTPSPTPLPTAASAAASAPVEGARRITQEDWINFAAIKRPATLYADKAMTTSIRTLEKGEMVRIFNETSSYAILAENGYIAGYFPAVNTHTVHCAQWPFHIDQPSAMVNNPLVSDRLHLRESPSQNARSLGRYYNGAIVTLLDDSGSKNGWAHVQIGGAEGYMMSAYLDFTPDPDEHHPCMSLFEVSNPTTGDLHLRAAPSTDSASLGLYKNGMIVAVFGVTGDWAHVICDGKTGFMLHKHLKTSLGTPFDPYW